MDEPLSNLDAKLRVQMRAEIARLQSDLGVTTIYVTHDQIEAMTMGDRVAVMRKGELQQVAPPQELYDRPRQPLRRRLHRQPGDEHPRGRRSSGERRPHGEDRQPEARARTRALLDSRPALQGYEGRTVDPRHPAGGPRGRRARSRTRPQGAAPRRGRAHRGARLRDHGALLRRREAGRDRGERELAQGRRRRGGRRRCRGGRRDLVGRFGATVARAEGRARPRSRSTPARSTSSTPRSGLGIYDQTDERSRSR